MSTSPDFRELQEQQNSPKLTKEETETVIKARRQLNTHSLVGLAIGSALGYYYGGAFLGNNLGAISGLLASLRTLRTLPDPNRVLAMIKEAQLRLVSSCAFKYSFLFMSLETGIGFPQKDVRKSRTQQGDTEELMTGPDEYEVDEATGELKRKTYDDGMNMGKSNSRDSKPMSTWERIREQARIKQQERQHQLSKPQSEPSSEDSFSGYNPSYQRGGEVPSSHENTVSNDGFGSTMGDSYGNSTSDADGVKVSRVYNPPRTREELEDVKRKGGVRTNQYGDPI
ncbi:5400_t:CDS:2 [Paraglomus brasilianum]|uniref:5400_t:CDS:1 n=1 Tax=Paraglomus brasilianum TaxID=144538 RepID=A0A9N8WCG2_9GLOM|nr:5400_t:CDS:2 [Paraglomus brasilianum]